MTKNMAGKIALGVTGVAITAGVVAGAALSNKKNRTALKKKVEKAAKKVNQIREMVEEGKERYQAIQHRINPKKIKQKVVRTVRKIKED